MPNYELLFKGSKTGSYLTIEPKKGSSVPVAVWETTAEDDWHLTAMRGIRLFITKKELVLPIKSIKTGRCETARFMYILCTRTDRSAYHQKVMSEPALRGITILDLILMC